MKLTAAAQDNLGDDAAARKAALDYLHSALFRGRLIAQERLQQGANGLDTARLLAAVQDEVISVSHRPYIMNSMTLSVCGLAL